MMTNGILQDRNFRERWDSTEEPGSRLTEETFQRYLRAPQRSRTVLNCAVSLSRARVLTDFEFPDGWDTNKCLVTRGSGNFPAGFENWTYRPRISAEAQLPEMRNLPAGEGCLERSPWFQSPSQAVWFGINARHLRYHYQLWQDLKPKVLRGLHTTLVCVTPQIGFSLTPHINLTDSFLFFGSLARAYAPIQLFPARYLFPDANLGANAGTPAPIFSDLLPCTGGYAFPVQEWTPDPWGMLARYEVTDRFYGYPFSRVTDATEDTRLRNAEHAPMLLPDGRRVGARESESLLQATLDPDLNASLKNSREEFEATHCLVRSTVTHDGLPFQLPVEMQTMVFAIILTHWQMELDRPGDLSSYVVRTRHAAIRGYRYFQRMNPHYANFMRMIRDLAKDPDFCTYPLAHHLAHSWLGGNLCISDQRSHSEREIGANLLRNYYLQQLDWQAGVHNLWNYISFRQAVNLENLLNFDGLAFHQMRRMLRFDSHLFRKPTVRASFWPGIHPGWAKLDRTNHADSLPRL